MDEEGERAAEILERFLHSRLNFCLLPYVHAVDFCPATRGSPYLLACPVGRSLVAAVEERDVRASFSQGLRDSPPDVARPTRYESCFARKVDGEHILKCPRLSEKCV
jgi:hypothetical protein